MRAKLTIMISLSSHFPDEDNQMAWSSFQLEAPRALFTAPQILVDWRLQSKYREYCPIHLANPTSQNFHFSPFISLPSAQLTEQAYNKRTLERCVTPCSVLCVSACAGLEPCLKKKRDGVIDSSQEMKTFLAYIHA